MVDACPECNNSTIYKRLSQQHADFPYRCGICGHTFKTPVSRPTLPGGPKENRHGQRTF